MSFGRILPAALLLGLGACAAPDDAVWTRSERLLLAPGRDFATCSATAVAGVPGLSSAENRPMKAYFDDYLVLGGPALDGLPGMVGDLSRRGATIQVEFTSRPRKLPDEATRAVGSSRVDLQACKLEYSIVSPK